MADETIENQEAVKVDEKIIVSPFDEKNWTSETPTVVTKEGEMKQEKAAEIKKEDPTFDADEYLNQQTGWKSWDEAKAAKAKLEEFEKAPKTEPLKFNETSEKILNALKEGKEDELYSYMQTKKQLERVEKLDIAKTKDAAEVIKLGMQYKNQDLTPDEVDFLFEEKFNIPEKPKQSEGQEDDEYAVAVEKWEKHKAMVEKKMVIEAKMTKPELSKYKSELVLPDIPKAEPVQQKELSPEELAANKKYVDDYLQSVDSDVKNFAGINVVYKDEAVEIPISYALSDEQKTSLTKQLKSLAANNFDTNSIFADRWLKEDGSVNVIQMTEDLSRVMYGKEMDKKFANDAASKRLAHQIKTKSNITIGGEKSQTTQQEEKTEGEKEVKHLWTNG